MGREPVPVNQARATATSVLPTFSSEASAKVQGLKLAAFSCD
jgi:hypothetical protein